LTTPTSGLQYERLQFDGFMPSEFPTDQANEEIYFQGLDAFLNSEAFEWSQSQEVF
jgi:hypothetical protein